MYVSVQVNEGEPNVMWLSGLHIPESYLTALVQATCRKNGWPLDKSTLYTSVTEVHVYIYVHTHVCVYLLNVAMFISADETGYHAKCMTCACMVLPLPRKCGICPNCLYTCLLILRRPLFHSLTLPTLINFVYSVTLHSLPQFIFPSLSLLVQSRLPRKLPRAAT